MVVSGLAVVVSMVGLYLAHDAVFASLATGSIIVVAIAVLGSLTVLPAMLAKIGNRIDRPRVPVLWRLTGQAGTPANQRAPRVWSAMLRPALGNPGRTLMVTVLALTALALPALGLTLHSDSQQSLPKSIPAVQTLDRISAAFPGQQSTDEIVVTAAPSAAAAVQHELQTVHDQLVGNGLFAAGGSPELAVSTDRTVHVLRVQVPFDPESGSARQGVTLLRNSLLRTARTGIPGSRWLVAGDAASSLDYDRHLASRLPWVIGFVVGLTMLIMLFVFSSVLIALLTAAMNLLSAGAAFGVLVLVFQHSWAEGLLGFRSTGAVINWIPLFTFAVLFGLSMDYHVFVLSRIREAALAGCSMPAAVRSGITRSAGTITNAAAVMVSVFAIFASLHMVEMKELGVSLAVAVLIDALVVRAVLLPAALVLLGPAAWWPSRLARRPWQRLEPVETERSIQSVLATPSARR